MLIKLALKKLSLPTTGTIPATEDVALNDVDRGTSGAVVPPEPVDDASSEPVAISTNPLTTVLASGAPEEATEFT